MWAIECTFYHTSIANANNMKATWVGKPGYLGGCTRTGVPNSPLVADAAVGYWAVGANPPNASTLPSWCKLVKIEESLKFVCGIT